MECMPWTAKVRAERTIAGSGPDLADLFRTKRRPCHMHNGREWPELQPKRPPAHGLLYGTCPQPHPKFFAYKHLARRPACLAHVQLERLTRSRVPPGFGTETSKGVVSVHMQASCEWCASRREEGGASRSQQQPTTADCNRAATKLPQPADGFLETGALALPPVLRGLSCATCP